MYTFVWGINPSLAAQLIYNSIKNVSLSTRYFSEANILETRAVI